MRQSHLTWVASLHSFLFFPISTISSLQVEARKVGWISRTLWSLPHSYPQHGFSGTSGKINIASRTTPTNTMNSSGLPAVHIPPIFLRRCCLPTSFKSRPYGQNALHGDTGTTFTAETHGQASESNIFCLFHAHSKNNDIVMYKDVCRWEIIVWLNDTKCRCNTNRMIEPMLSRCELAPSITQQNRAPRM